MLFSKFALSFLIKRQRSGRIYFLRVASKLSRLSVNCHGSYSGAPLTKNTIQLYDKLFQIPSSCLVFLLLFVHVILEVKNMLFCLTIHPSTTAICLDNKPAKSDFPPATIDPRPTIKLERCLYNIINCRETS